MKHLAIIVETVEEFTNILKIVKKMRYRWQGDTEIDPANDAVYYFRGTPYVVMFKNKMQVAWGCYDGKNTYHDYMKYDDYCLKYHNFNRKAIQAIKNIMTKETSDEMGLA